MSRILLALAAAGVASLGLYTPQQQASADVSSAIHVAVVGDMACDPEDSDFHGGSGVASDCQQMAVADAMDAGGPWDAVVGLGDFQYECDDPADFLVSYDPSFGRFDPLMNPTPGNHEYQTGVDVHGDECPTDNKTAAGYFQRFELSSHPDTNGWYSFDEGSWHFISLNANCASTGGCGAKAPETVWLKNDLATTRAACIAAFWHQPLYTGQGTGYVSKYKPWWTALYKKHADVVLNGHIHDYQRFAPMDPAKTPDVNGITEYVVGTGGETQTSVKASTTPQPEYWKKSFGYMHLDLTDAGWHSSFVTIDGQTLDDHNGTCN